MPPIAKDSLDSLAALLKKLPKGQWVVDDNASPVIYAGEMRVADIRGWGHLTGSGLGGLALPEDTARDIQIDIAQFIAGIRNNAEALIAAARERDALQNVVARMQGEALAQDVAVERLRGALLDDAGAVAQKYAAASKRIAEMEAAFAEIIDGDYHNCRTISRNALGEPGPVAEPLAELVGLYGKKD